MVYNFTGYQTDKLQVEVLNLLSDVADALFALALNADLEVVWVLVLSDAS